MENCDTTIRHLGQEELEEEEKVESAAARNHRLLTLLLEDAHQFAPPYTFDELEEQYRIDFITGIYTEQCQLLATRPGYPRLYRCAWKLLASAVRERDWETLHHIFCVQRQALEHSHDWLDCTASTQEKVSLWHLKAVLYCWAYLRDARELGQGAQFDADLLARRRPAEEAAQWLSLLRPLNCFVNMHPREAHDALEMERGGPEGDYHRAYLFRLSTTLPGLIAVSVLAPVSKRPIDMRLSPQEALQLVGCTDLYSALLKERLRNRQSVDVRQGYDAAALADLMRTLEQPKYYDSQVFLERMKTLIPTAQWTREFEMEHAIALTRRAYWNRVSTIQLEAHTVEQRVGLSQSYVESYNRPSIVESFVGHSCFNCRRNDLPESEIIYEPLNGQQYCGAPCYAEDFEKCH